jgi:hypothetical protein
MLLFSCGVAKSPIEGTPTKQEQPTDYIVFLVFKMQKETDTNKITLIDQIIKPGIMKSEPEATIDSDTYLSIDLFQNNKLLKTIKKEHPLYKHIEYTDDNNQLTSKNIEVEQDDFFIRIQKKSFPIQVKISEVIKNNLKKELLILKI